MVSALFDTNILIDYLNNVSSARTEFARFDRRAVSIITWMEVLVGAKPGLEEATRIFLDHFDVLGIDEPMAERAVDLRRQYRIKLPDAVIWAAAQTTGRLFVTRNAKDFPANDPGIRIPYRI